MVDFRLESFEGRFPKVAKLSTWNWADLNLKLFLVSKRMSYTCKYTNGITWIFSVIIATGIDWKSNS